MNRSKPLELTEASSLISSRHACLLFCVLQTGCMAVPFYTSYLLVSLWKRQSCNKNLRYLRSEKHYPITSGLFYTIFVMIWKRPVKTLSSASIPPVISKIGRYSVI